MNKTKRYDYIILGAGAAGLSLLMHMMQHSFFKGIKILVVDKAPKNKNDHTWCFWERQAGLFESVVYHSWQQMHFFSSQFSGLIDLSPYRYKMIRSIDFYNYVVDETAKHPNIDFKYGDVSSASTEGERGVVSVSGEEYYATYVFNSIIFSQPKVAAGKHYLLQHFKGYVITTKQSAFDPVVATLMDFRVSQKHGTTFVYVLPISEKKALVEYTLFTENLLKQEEYDDGLKSYIGQYLKLNEFEIEEEEFGIIPMTNVSFPKSAGRVINIGTAGGQTKGSSGYTFKFVQQHSKKITEALVNNIAPVFRDEWLYKRFKLYDSIFLNVLANRRLPGERIFAELFKNNQPQRVLRFLDNDSTIADDFKIITTLPTMPFLKAGLQELFI